MKNILEHFFNRQRDYWQSEDGTYPQLPYNNAMNECMIVQNSLDDDGYIQWKPVLQEERVDYSELETRLNIKINPKIKQYFTSYWFLSLIGKLGETTLDFLCVPYGVNILNLVEEHYNLGKRNFPDENACFEFGFADIDGDDSYLIYVDNETTIVKCVQIEDNVSIELGVLEDVISKMDVGI